MPHECARSKVLHSPEQSDFLQRLLDKIIKLIKRVEDWRLCTQWVWQIS